MKRKRFTEEQLIEVLRLHGSGAKLPIFAGSRESAKRPYYNWRAKYGG